MADLIEPRTLRGFRDYPPELMIPRERLLETARRVYRSFGFAPIDTPALEYTEILMGKGGDESDRLIYRFKDHGDRDVAMRFDLTVPFARFAAQNISKLGTPFKRYAMGPVWRGENAARGRYREFWQCDFDTIGTTSNASDTETALVICELFTALGFKRFEVRINNRLLLNGLLEQIGAADKAVPVLRALDKLPKVGRTVVFRELTGAPEEAADIILLYLQARSRTVSLPQGSEEQMPALQKFITDTLNDLKPLLLRLGPFDWDSILPVVVTVLLQFCANRAIGEPIPSTDAGRLRREIAGAQLSKSQADQILSLVALQGSNTDILQQITQDFGTNEKVAEGIRRLAQLLEIAKAAGVPEDNIRLDLSIARGLDYYTGTIYETFLLDKPDIGSVCSGGRYDNLAGLYTKQSLPGVGASLGVDRLLAAMEEMGLIEGVSTPAPVLVVQFAEEYLPGYARIAQLLRRSGINTEVYPEAKKLGAQFKYAESRGAKIALIAGPDEFAQGVWKVKDLARRQETTVPESGLVEAVRGMLQ
jgi:histidyl-tRNA synthetase